MSKIVLATTIASTFAADLAQDEQWSAFQDFIGKYGRQYMTEAEVAGRFEIFKDNVLVIADRNNRGSAKHGINQFTDLSSAEFASRYLQRQSTALNLTKKEFPHVDNFKAKSVNWCDQGHCTPVKNQGQCGSCWAFGGVESLESDFSIRYGKLYDLSTQQVTSCDTNDGGCAGGNAVNAWAYANATGGIEQAKYYPYTSGSTKQTGSCDSSKVVDRVVSACSYSWISQGSSDEQNMITDILQTPLSVAVAADYWQTYVSGVVSSTDGCGPSSKYPIDHNVQVIGFNAKGNYYIVRNSWGTGWGNAGFIYVEAGSNVCGIAQEAAAVVTCPAPTADSVSV